jgi:two-component system phosphate regulon sensor histidine kinase PhoR
VVLLDPQGRIEWCNQTAADHFGFDLQRDLMQQVTNLVRDPSFAAFYSGGSDTRDVVIPGPRSAPSRPVKLSLYLHPYGEGRRLLLSRDVTAVEQAEVMRRDFVANVSHEIRTPLTVLVGFVETLQNLPLDDKERARYLGLMAQQAQRMQTLVGDLLTLSRLEGSPLPGAGEWTAMAVLMAQCEQDGRRYPLLDKPLVLRLIPAGWKSPGRPGNCSVLSSLVKRGPLHTGRGLMGHGACPMAGASFRARYGQHRARAFAAQERLPRRPQRSRETGGTGWPAIVKRGAAASAELTVESTPSGIDLCDAVPGEPLARRRARRQEPRPMRAPPAENQWQDEAEQNPSAGEREGGGECCAAGSHVW